MVDAFYIFIIAIRPAVIDSRKFSRRFRAIGITKVGIMPYYFMLHVHIILQLMEPARRIKMAPM